MKHSFRGIPQRRLRAAVSATLAIAASSIAPAAGAFEFTVGQGRGSWDTTVSWGQGYRVENPDLNLIATANGGIGRSPNIDDGNLNYDTGLYSNALKLITEISYDVGNYGAFVRGSALYDMEVMDQQTRRTPISETAKNSAGSYVRLLDAFVYGKWDLGGRELDVRLGRQVVSWGESTFIQGGINTLNHFDVAALRVPGSELREAFLPQEMARFSFGVSQNVTIEGLYVLDWDDTEPEPVGTYFSSNDFVPDGGSQVFLGFGAFSDQGVDFRPLGGSYIRDFQAVRRGQTREPDKNGQFGVALKWFVPGLNDGTEFGFYYINYHSRLPMISGTTGTQAGIGNAAGAATAAGAAAQALASGLPLNTAIALAANAGRGRAVLNGGNLTLAQAAEYVTIGANTALRGGNVSAQATNLATHEYAKTAEYYTEFPEDIQLIGVSFNTQLGMTGIALQGEISLRMDQPLQYDDVEVLFGALSPLEQGLISAGVSAGPLPGSCIPQAPTISRCGQLGQFAPNSRVQGWDYFDVYQVQVTATKAFGPMLGASQLVSVLEWGLTHVTDFPDKTTGGPNGRGIRFNGPGTSVSGNDLLAGRHFGEVEPQGRFADANSWGYRVALRLDYPSAIGAWNVSPRFVWSHDVKGTSPGPGGNFIADRYGATFGVLGNLQNTWEVDVSYTQFGGAGRFNDLNDRDFVAATVKYSF